MLYIDGHCHVDALTWDNLKSMALAGIRGIVSPIQLGAAKPLKNIIIQSMWDYLIDVQYSRAKEHLIEPYGMIGISMVSTPSEDVEGLYNLLPEYLVKPGVVGVGEIGFEPNSMTCRNLEKQEEYVRKQVRIVKKAGVIVDFHVPHIPELKRKYTEKILQICIEEGLPMKKVAVDHCSEANLDIVVESGAWAAITVQPWRGITPERAAELVEKHGYERTMVDSDCSGLPSDPLSVPKTALAMRKIGMDEDIIEKVCYLNSCEFYELK